MKWKEFLKTDWRKIVIFAAIFVLLFFIPTIPTSVALPTAIGAKGDSATVWSSFYSQLSYSYGTPIDIIAYMIIPIMISLIISYILSCLIVRIYDKLRKKK
jgi:hypothetical protein